MREADREIDQATFAAALRDGAPVIDVREPDEYATGHVSGARLVPLSQLPYQLAELPRTGPIYVICATGRRSLEAADFLAANGVDGRSVAGGTKAWMRSGNPVVEGMRSSAV